MISRFVSRDEEEYRQLKGQWERFLIKTCPVSGLSSRSQNLIITGSDSRGTSYGVFEVSKQLGVSPWYWWADVPIIKKSTLRLDNLPMLSKSPTVKYRGIFINDEDWGLQPWAAKTFEPEVGDIGPKTYSRIFELLLRLRGNTIWPAMHPSTKAFFHYPGNPEIAKKYHIVIGSSHAEPMLRNNVDEWKESDGAFNYKINKEKIENYWNTRVKQSKELEAIYTLGIRGIHDSGMEGVKNTEEAAEILDGIIKDQRDILALHRKENITEIPQAFTVYKEVLSIYDQNLSVPDDITLVWTDDNYGYIRRLSNSEERKRSGGAGVYYHASYWGRPHDYLWLSTTHPSLIREEMWKAYKTGADRLWILNVGDIKPAEYNLQLFMDMAYDMEAFRDAQSLNTHRKNFYTRIFGSLYGHEISQIRKKYYDLAFERKPEYMGWSQTEPTTEVHETDYDPFLWGDQIQKRIDAYKSLGHISDSIYSRLPKKLKDAYFQLVHYPVKAAMFMNMKYLYRDLAVKYNREGRLIAKKYKDQSIQSHHSVVEITRKYNTNISHGKWNYMMDMAPRKLPVFQVPEITISSYESGDLYGYGIEGQRKNKNLLPFFYVGQNDRYFIDVFLKKHGEVSWSIKNRPQWVKVSQSYGKLSSYTGKLQQRIYFEIDWDTWEQSDKPMQAKFLLRLNQENFPVYICVKNIAENSLEGFLEKNGMAVAYASHFSSVIGNEKYSWKILEDIGHSGNVMQAYQLDAMPLDSVDIKDDHPKLTYYFVTETVTEDAKLFLFALPTHPITNDHKVRIGIQWDDRPVEIVNFQTHDRSDQWKRNVLRNLASVCIPVELSKKGKHRLKIYMIDPGIALDFYYLQTKEETLPYSILPETNIIK